MILKNQIDIAFHEARSGAEDQFLELSWKFPDTIYGVMLFENGLQFWGADRMERK